MEIRSKDATNSVAYATGCVISDDGKILTNKHVVMSTDSLFESIEVRFYNSNDFVRANLLKISETDDVAFIQIEQDTEAYFRVGTEIKGGERVFTIGNPDGIGLSFCEGVVSSPLRYIQHNGQTIKATQTSISINEGNSGGPLFNLDGELVGLMTFRWKNSTNEALQGVSFALHYSVIAQFLQSI